jgi:hypothetical protein
MLSATKQKAKRLSLKSMMKKIQFLFQKEEWEEEEITEIG